VLDTGEDRASRPFPVVANSLTATAVGDLDAALLFSVPSPDELARLEEMLLGTMGPDARARWDEARARLRELIGVDFEELAAAIGPEIVVLFDAAGDYAAVHLRDAARFDDLVRRIAAATGAAPEEQTVLGTTFHHWRLPSTYSLGAGAAGAQGDAGDFLTLVSRLRDHAYWLREGDYLYVAPLPQPLMDRVRAGAQSSVAEWFADRQRLDVSAAFFAASGSVSKMPRRNYESYVKAMQVLADLGNVAFDAYAMPTADQLDLPEQGSVGFALNLGARYVSIEFSYENHPGELLFGGGAMSTVAVTGILAAIAIPAYQDYTIRAQVAEGLNLAAAVKAAVAEDYFNEGTPPVDRRDAGLDADPTATAGRYVASVDVTDGAITIVYGNAANAAIYGGTLTITPYEGDDGAVVWRCGNAPVLAGTRPLGARAGRADPHVPPTLSPKYLPAACR
jgi:Tfp pilus assembly major pilin PilA